MHIYDGKYDKKIFHTNHTAAVVSTNQIVCDKNDYMTIRKNGREDWSLFYCETGRMHIDNTILEEGQVWIYAPGVSQKYTIYSKDKTIYRYLHFTGSDVKELLSSLEIKLSTPIRVKSNSLTSIFEKIQNATTDDSAFSKLSAEYHILHLLSILAQCCTEFSEVYMLKRITDNMEHSFANNYNASAYADMLKVSVSRFNHLFKQYMGISPYAYYVKLRMTNACNLLIDTNLKIHDIANKCGYDDAIYFTQAFKKSVGLTPSEYRKSNQFLSDMTSIVP